MVSQCYSYYEFLCANWLVSMSLGVQAMHEMTKQIIQSKSRVHFHNFKFLNTGVSPCSPATGACESTLTFYFMLFLSIREKLMISFL